MKLRFKNNYEDNTNWFFSITPSIFIYCISEKKCISLNWLFWDICLML